jgi:uncharacterized protein (DUF58 family)
MTTPITPQSAQPSTLLEPATLQKFGSLELIARRVVDGFLRGMHRSPHVGFAMDFAHHRPYSPGDDVRRIDWRAFARSERLYLKQHEVNTNLRAHILLDASASMAYRGADDAVSKFRYAQMLAASLAYLVLRQKDSVGLTTFDNQFRQTVSTRSVPSHLAHILAALGDTKAENESAISPLLHEFAGRIGSRGMVILLSDFFADAPSIVNALHHLRREGHEVLLFHILSPDELAFPFRTRTTFEDLENPSDLRRLEPALMRSTYLANLKSHLDSLRDAAHRLAIRYALLTTTQPLDVALATLLN